MTFLTWDNQDDAENSVAALNVMYGCPYTAENGYRMDRWDFVIKSFGSYEYGFFKPEERMGMKIDDLMSGLMPGFTEHKGMPSEFRPPDPFSGSDGND